VDRKIHLQLVEMDKILTEAARPAARLGPDGWRREPRALAGLAGYGWGQGTGHVGHLPPGKDRAPAARRRWGWASAH
jgi:hypothetical protein